MRSPISALRHLDGLSHAAPSAEWLDTILKGDCVAALERLPENERYGADFTRKLLNNTLRQIEALEGQGG